METAPVKPKRKIIQTVIVSILIVAAVLWIAGAIVIELTNNVPMSDETMKTDYNSAVESL
jgi:galactitol-specific phosphotransferase system IIC component